MGSHENIVEPQVVPADPAKIKKIWMTALILGVITAVEFFIAFVFPHSVITLKVWLFIILTIVKAYFIVSEFMHLGHERKALVYSIILPLMFLCWGILAFLMEATAVHEAIKKLWLLM